MNTLKGLCYEESTERNGAFEGKGYAGNKSLVLFAFLVLFSSYETDTFGYFLLQVKRTGRMTCFQDSPKY